MTPAKRRQGEKRRPQRWVPWPVALRQVRGWLMPWTVLQRWWHAWRQGPLPSALQMLLEWVAEGNALNVYLAPN